MANLADLSRTLTEHLSAHPEDALEVLSAVEGVIRSAAFAPPAITIVPGHEDEEGEWIETTILNPRTGEADTLIAVDTSLRYTEACSDVDFDVKAKVLHIDYDGCSDYDGLVYLTESDQLPASLPEEWSEE